MLDLYRFIYRDSVEHTCYRCGARVEEGVNFCPACGAPQIRVSRAEPPPEPSAQPIHEQPPAPPYGGPAGFPAPAAESFEARQHPIAAQQVSPGEFNWQHGLPSAALGGVIGALLSVVPILIYIFPLWMASTGAFAVSFYRRRRNLASVRGGVGARLGALAGAIGFVPCALVLAIEFLVMSRTGMLHDALQHANVNNADPQVQQQMQQMMAWVQTPQGSATVVVAVLVFCFLGFVILGAIGGALWASMTGKQEKNF